MQEEKHDNLLEVEENEVTVNKSVLAENENIAIETIDNLNAEENEAGNSKGDAHLLEMKDYEAMEMEELVEDLEKLIGFDHVNLVQNHVNELKNAFLSKYNHFIEEKKEDFFKENPDTTENFQYHFPLKTKFDHFLNKFREQKNHHFKKLESNLKGNLETRLSLIEELKSLINTDNDIKENLKRFNDLRERWKLAGPIPKDKYNHVWNNYHFHLENFYDYLHLDREARDIDFKHNIDAKLKIIERAQELLAEADVMKAFRELQSLHKIWKEDIGPVSKEYREEIWVIFSNITKQMHEKREAIFEQQRAKELENLAIKNEIIASIEEITNVKLDGHINWQSQVEKIESLRERFFVAGKVPIELNEETWSKFKNAVRNFNIQKNNFFKETKKEQLSNLDKKNALVAKAKELQDNDDFEATTPIMKKIQEEWKQIGHVPKSFSDTVWNEFKTACNHYFDRYHAKKNESESEEIAAFEKKKEFLENFKTFELVGDHKQDLQAIKGHIEHWKSIGKVPLSRRHIEGKFNKILDVLFEKLNMSKKETEMMRFTNRLDSLVESNDTRKMDNEKMFLTKKIDEVQNEIFQLENNIQFFAKAKKDSPMVLEVKKNIERLKEELITWKEKLNLFKKNT